MQNRFLFEVSCVLICTAPALAHAHLLHANPATGAILKTSPTMIRLDFSETLEPVFSSLTVTDDKGTSTNATPSVVTGREMQVALKKLAPGHYHVHWVSVATDTHRLIGDYDFTVAP